VIARQQLAEVLVASLTSGAAARKTFELVATKGSAQINMEPLFAALEMDSSDGIDGVHDENNQPLEQEPQRVQDDLRREQARRSGGKR
jgi:hypothetical protein